MKKHKHLLTLALVLGLAGVAKSQTTDWGTSVSFYPLGYDSSANAWGSSLTWTIGWFSDGFIPTASNAMDWAANYHEVDRNTEQAYDLGDGTLVYNVGGHKNDGGLESYNRQAYVFAYNNLGLMGQAGGEAVLFVQNGFVFPDVLLQDTFDVGDNPLDTNDDSFDVIWGQVDRDIGGVGTTGSAVGGVVSGGGLYSNQLTDSTNGTWEAQTAAWVLIPEPSTALLGVLASLTLFRRKRASMAA